MNTDNATPELLPVDDAVVRYARDGFFHCGHCRRVVTPCQRAVEVAENAPAGSLVKLKCPLCQKWEVQWRFPSKPRPPKPKPAPVSQERAAQFFSELKAIVN